MLQRDLSNPERAKYGKLLINEERLMVQANDSVQHWN